MVEPSGSRTGAGGFRYGSRPAPAREPKLCLRKKEVILHAYLHYIQPKTAKRWLQNPAFFPFLKKKSLE